MKFWLMICLIACSITVQAKDAPLQTVSQVDLDNYMGLWYEIARLPNKFQKGCTNSTALYEWRKDGDLRVTNSCDLPGQKERESAKGRAWVKNKETMAQWKIQFALTGLRLGFMAGDYWILALDDGYDYVLVGGPSRKYLWILSRTKTLPEETVAQLVATAKAAGFKVDKLIFNPKN